MTHTTFRINNNNNATTFNSDYSFHKSSDYSKALDAIIAANIKASNPYLNGYSCCNILKSEPITDEFTSAANFLANYDKKKTKKIPFIIGKIYKLSNGTPIIFYDDEIQIGFDLFSYSSFGDKLFLKKMNPAAKKLIIKIFTSGSDNISININ